MKSKETVGLTRSSTLLGRTLPAMTRRAAYDASVTPCLGHSPTPTAGPWLGRVMVGHAEPVAASVLVGSAMRTGSGTGGRAVCGDTTLGPRLTGVGPLGSAGSAGLTGTPSPAQWAVDEARPVSARGDWSRFAGARHRLSSDRRQAWLVPGLGCSSQWRLIVGAWLPAGGWMDAKRHTTPGSLFSES